MNGGVMVGYLVACSLGGIVTFAPRGCGTGSRRWPREFGTLRAGDRNAGVDVDLSEAIEALRESLKTSIQSGKGDWMQFVLDPIELEVEAVVTKDANGKVGWKIIEESGGYESAKTQRLKLRLTPMWRTPDGVLVRDFTVADSQPPGKPPDFGGL
jgi:hypothetical protein